MTGKGPISVRWVDINKGDDENPNYRSRLVAREIRRRGDAPAFAATPPLEVIRLQISNVATLFDSRAHSVDPCSPERAHISFVDIKRAYFNAWRSEDSASFIQLPPEDPDYGSGLCGKLLMHMYGTKDAAQGWEDTYAAAMVSLGFERGVACPCVFFPREEKLQSSVHGDDFTTTGSKFNLDWFEDELEQHFELTRRGRLGPGPEDDTELMVLNRVVRWTDTGIEYEGDPRHVERLVPATGAERLLAVSTPGVRARVDEAGKSKSLSFEKSKQFRKLAARANYVSLDRPDCQFAAKEICRSMASPTAASRDALVRLAQYLTTHRRWIWRFPFQGEGALAVYTDTDWAGCPITRKSTNGGCVFLGDPLIKTWSSTQNSVALSPGEAEYYGIVKGASEGLGLRSVSAELGCELPLGLHTDASAAEGIARRRGLGKLRHVEVQALWVQDRMRKKDFSVHKVKGVSNPADIFTKHLCRDKRSGPLGQLGGYFEDGRPSIVPTACDEDEGDSVSDLG